VITNPAHFLLDRCAEVERQNPESRRALYLDPHLHPLPHGERRQRVAQSSPYGERRQSGPAVAHSSPHRERIAQSSPLQGEETEILRN
jgi:hypothetical protein